MENWYDMKILRKEIRGEFRVYSYKNGLLNEKDFYDLVSIFEWLEKNEINHYYILLKEEQLIKVQRRT